MSYVKPLFPNNVRYGLGTAGEDVSAGHGATLTDHDVFAHADSTAFVFGLFVKDTAQGKMPGIYCCGGIYETDVFEGTLSYGDPLKMSANGKLTKSTEDSDQIVGHVISVVSGVLRFKLFV